MTQYRMYLGRKNAEGVIYLREVDAFIDYQVAPLIDGFTVLEGVGYWQGNREPVTIIEVVGEASVYDLLVDGIAHAYAVEFTQDAVLVTRVEVGMELIEGRKAA